MKSYCLLNLLALPLQNATMSIRYAHHAHAIYSILAPIINSQNYRRALIPFKISIDIDIDRQLLFLFYFIVESLGHLPKVSITTFDPAQKGIDNLPLAEGILL